MFWLHERRKSVLVALMKPMVLYVISMAGLVEMTYQIFHGSVLFKWHNITPPPDRV